jgi:acyl transferase domain-containing protein
VPGEGGAFFVLKREADALRDHDRIYALLRAFAFGRAAPDTLLSAAADRAGVNIHAIRLVEADGSGIPEADQLEAESICRLWGTHRPGGPLVGLGSVKGNIGHCFAAASAAGALKAALALHEKVLPPQVASEQPLACLSHLASPAYVLNTARPWITGDAKQPRCAAVMARDFSGRAGVLVLGEERALETADKGRKGSRHAR